MQCRTVFKFSFLCLPSFVGSFFCLVASEAAVTGPGIRAGVSDGAKARAYWTAGFAVLTGVAAGSLLYTVVSSRETRWWGTCRPRPPSEEIIQGQPNISVVVYFQALVGSGPVSLQFDFNVKIC